MSPEQNPQTLNEPSNGIVVDRLLFHGVMVTGNRHPDGTIDIKPTPAEWKAMQEADQEAVLRQQSRKTIRRTRGTRP